MADTIIFWINVGCAVGSIICLIASIVSAHKASKYYKKSMHISLVLQCNNSLDDMQRATTLLMELLQYTEKNRSKRSRNIAIAIYDTSKEIQLILQNINRNLTSSEAKEFQNKLKESGFDCQNYIIRIAAGDYTRATEDGNEFFYSDWRFIKCQELFGEATRYLNELLDVHKEKIK